MEISQGSRDEGSLIGNVLGSSHDASSEASSGLRARTGHDYAHGADSTDVIVGAHGAHVTNTGIVPSSGPVSQPFSSSHALEEEAGDLGSQIGLGLNSLPRHSLGLFSLDNKWAPGGLSLPSMNDESRERAGLGSLADVPEFRPSGSGARVLSASVPSFQPSVPGMNDWRTLEDAANAAAMDIFAGDGYGGPMHSSNPRGVPVTGASRFGPRPFAFVGASAVLGPHRTAAPPPPPPSLAVSPYATSGKGGKSKGGSKGAAVDMIAAAGYGHGQGAGPGAGVGYGRPTGAYPPGHGMTSLASSAQYTAPLAASSSIGVGPRGPAAHRYSHGQGEYHPSPGPASPYVGSAGVGQAQAVGQAVHPPAAQHGFKAIEAEGKVIPKGDLAVLSDSVVLPIPTVRTFKPVVTDCKQYARNEGACSGMRPCGRRHAYTLRLLIRSQLLKTPYVPICPYWLQDGTCVSRCAGSHPGYESFAQRALWIVYSPHAEFDVFWDMETCSTACTLHTPPKSGRVPTGQQVIQAPKEPVAAVLTAIRSTLAQLTGTMPSCRADCFRLRAYHIPTSISAADSSTLSVPGAYVVEPIGVEPPPGSEPLLLSAASKTILLGRLNVPREEKKAFQAEMRLQRLMEAAARSGVLFSALRDCGASAGGVGSVDTERAMSGEDDSAARTEGEVGADPALNTHQQHVESTHTGDGGDMSQVASRRVSSATDGTALSVADTGGGDEEDPSQEHVTQMQVQPAVPVPALKAPLSSTGGHGTAAPAPMPVHIEAIMGALTRMPGLAAALSSLDARTISLLPPAATAAMAAAVASNIAYTPGHALGSGLSERVESSSNVPATPETMPVYVGTGAARARLVQDLVAHGLRLCPRPSEAVTSASTIPSSDADFVTAVQALIADDRRNAVIARVRAAELREIDPGMAAGALSAASRIERRARTATCLPPRIAWWFQHASRRGPNQQPLFTVVIAGENLASAQALFNEVTTALAAAAPGGAPAGLPWPTPLIMVYGGLPQPALVRGDLAAPECAAHAHLLSSTCLAVPWAFILSHAHWTRTGKELFGTGSEAAVPEDARRAETARLEGAGLAPTTSGLPARGPGKSGREAVGNERESALETHDSTAPPSPTPSVSASAGPPLLGAAPPTSLPPQAPAHAPAHAYGAPAYSGYPSQQQGHVQPGPAFATKPTQGQEQLQALPPPAVPPTSSLAGYSHAYTHAQGQQQHPQGNAYAQGSGSGQGQGPMQAALPDYPSAQGGGPVQGEGGGYPLQYAYGQGQGRGPPHMSGVMPPRDAGRALGQHQYGVAPGAMGHMGMHMHHVQGMQQPSSGQGGYEGMDAYGRPVRALGPAPDLGPGPGSAMGQAVPPYAAYGVGAGEVMGQHAMQGRFQGQGQGQSLSMGLTMAQQYGTAPVPVPLPSLGLPSTAAPGGGEGPSQFVHLKDIASLLAVERAKMLEEVTRTLKEEQEKEREKEAAKRKEEGKGSASAVRQSLQLLPRVVTNSREALGQPSLAKGPPTRAELGPGESLRGFGSRMRANAGAREGAGAEAPLAAPTTPLTGPPLSALHTGQSAREDSLYRPHLGSSSGSGRAASTASAPAPVTPAAVVVRGRGMWGQGMEADPPSRSWNDDAQAQGDSRSSSSSGQRAWSSDHARRVAAADRAAALQSEREKARVTERAVGQTERERVPSHSAPAPAISPSVSQPPKRDFAAASVGPGAAGQDVPAGQGPRAKERVGRGNTDRTFSLPSSIPTAPAETPGAPPPPLPPPAAERRHALKPELCNLYLAGRCTRGESCYYCHSAGQLEDVRSRLREQERAAPRSSPRAVYLGGGLDADSDGGYVSASDGLSMGREREGTGYALPSNRRPVGPGAPNPAHVPPFPPAAEGRRKAEREERVPAGPPLASKGVTASAAGEERPVCRNFKRGICKQGAACARLHIIERGGEAGPAHEEVETRADPVRGVDHDGEQDSPVSAGEEGGPGRERPVHSYAKKCYMCKLFVTGKCRRGAAECAYAHGEEELSRARELRKQGGVPGQVMASASSHPLPRAIHDQSRRGGS